MKAQLLEATRAHRATLVELQKKVRAYSKAQVQANTLLSAAQVAATTWFDGVKPLLQEAGCPAQVIDDNSSNFEALLKLSRGRPRKTVLLKAISRALPLYEAEIIHPIEIGRYGATGGGLSIAPFVEGLSEGEGEYLDEAQRCLTVNALRGCIVLGWCATISRIQSKIEEIGFDKFSKATVEMHAKNVGRFKPFKHKYEIETLSELQRVFDTHVLWVLEYMQLIDGNQHERLRHCFEFRNNSAHPGLAPIKPANLYSFYSDISEIVLKNPKFALSSRTNAPAAK